MLSRVSVGQSLSGQRGFTLIEAIVVMVITGIIAAVVALFIRAPVQGYFDSVQRAELSDAADTALRRMTRDLRRALPNSVRISDDGQAIEFLLTRSGGRYLDESDAAGEDGRILDFQNPGNTSFDAIGPVEVEQGNYIAVYNLGPGMEPADAWSGGNLARVERVSGNDNVKTITLADNPFAQQASAMPSPGRRFQVVTTPVTYACEGNDLKRYWAYEITTVQQTPLELSGKGQSALLAKGVKACAFSHTSLAQAFSALVGLSLTLERNDEAITLFQQVHLDNTP